MVSTRALCLLLVTLAGFPALAAPGWGAWMREKDDVVGGLGNLPSIPAFLVMKAGIFDKTGGLRIVAQHERVLDFCRRNVEMHAWVTHRVGKKTGLNRAGGQTLGGHLNKLLDESCFASVELDMEPIGEPAPGMIEFLEEVRRTMRKDRKLYVALPPIAPPTTKGLTFTEADAEKVLAVVDGIDLMLYDTGLDDRRDFGKVIERGVAFAKKHPGKDVRLGLPAYYDEGRFLHRLGIESSTVAVETLRGLLPNALETLCSPEVRILYYAYWTLKREDFENARALDATLKERCASRPKGKHVTPLR